MGEIGSLSVRINAKTEQLEKSLGGVQKSLQNTGKRVGAAGKSMTKWVTGPIAGATAAIGGLVMKTANWADELLDLSESTGISTGTLQEWREVARRAGTDQDAVAKGTDRLRRQYNDLAEGQGTAADGFEALGIDVKDAGGEMKGMEDLVDDAMYALADVEDQSERNAIATEIFGGATEDILPILADSSEELENVRDEANVVDEEQLEQLDNLRELWDRLKGKFMDTAREIASDLAPIIEDKLVPAIKEHLMPFVEQLGDRIGKLIEWFMDLDPWVLKVIGGVVALAAVLGPIMMILGPIIKLIGILIPLAKGLAAVFIFLTSPSGLVVAAVAALIAIGWLLYANWEEITDWLKEIWENIKDFFVELWEEIREWFFEFLEGIKEFFEETWNALKEWFFELLEGIKEFFEETWTALKDWFFGLLEDILDKVTEIWDWIDEHILGAARDIYDNIKDWIGKAIDWAADAWEGFRDTVGNIWDGITDNIKGAVNSIIGLVNGMISGIEGGINFVVRGINRFIDTINSAIRGLNEVPGVNISTIGSLSEVSLGNIPTLHDGGVFRAPNPGGEGLALLEDRERVIPAGMSDGGSFAPQGGAPTYNITNHFTPPESTPAEHKRKQKQLLRELAVEWGMS